MNVNERFQRAVLTDARGRRVPWYEIVRAIQDLQSQAINDEHGRPWIAYAQDVSGYNYIQLREMIRTYDTVKWLESCLKISSKDIFTSFPKHNIEIVSRIRKINEESAIEVFHRMLKEKLTVNSLREIYDDIKDKKKTVRSGVSLGKTLSTDFERNCFSLIKDQRHEFYKYLDEKIDEQDMRSCKIVEFTGKHEYISPSFVIVTNYGGSNNFIIAVDCAFTSIENDERIARRLKNASFDAAYFSKLYLMVPSWTHISRINTIKDKLDIKDVGIFSADIDGQSIDNRDSHPLVIIKTPKKILRNTHAIISAADKKGEELIPPEPGQDLSGFVP